MLQSIRFHALLLFVISGLPFLGVFRGDMWIPMVGDIAPPWGPPPATRIEDHSGSDLPAFTYPNLVVESHARPIASLFDASVGDPGTILWNPGQLCGTPFLATQSTFALHPAHLLPWKSPIQWQFAVLAWIHAWIAALGCYFLSRRLGLEGIPALIAGTTFGAGPWMSAHHDTLASMTACWIPWLVFAGMSVLGTTRYRSIIGMMAVTAMTAISGMAQLFQVGLVAVALSVKEGFDESLRACGNRQVARGLLRLSFALLLGTSLAAPQLLPLAELALESPRTHSASQLQRDLAVPWTEWLTFGWPEIAGTSVALNRASQGPTSVAVPPEGQWPMARLLDARSSGGATYLEAAVSPGACVFVFVLVGLFFGRHRARPLAILLGLVGILISLRSPWFDWIQQIPTLAVGNPRRWLLLTALGGSLLVGEGVQALSGLSSGQRRVFASMAFIPTFGWMMCFLFPDTIAHWLALTSGAATDLARINVTSLLNELWIPAALCLVIAFVIGLRCLPPATWWLIVACTLIDGTSQALRVNPLLPAASIFPPSQTTDYLLKGYTELRDPIRSPTSHFGSRTLPWRIARLTPTETSAWIPPLPPNSPMLFGLRDAAGYEALVPRRLEELWNAVESGSVHEHHYLRPFHNGAVTSLPLMDFMGIRYWLATRVDVPSGLNRVAAVASERTAIFENPRWLRHVSWVNRVRTVASESEALAIVTSRSFNPREEVVFTLDQAATLGLASRPPSVSAVGDEIAQVTELNLTSARCTYRVDATSDGFLVLAESYHRGWKARNQEGRELPLAIANHAFQAIFVPRGTTEVTWSFEPVSWRLGLWVAALALLVLLAGGILARRNAS